MLYEFKWCSCLVFNVRADAFEIRQSNDLMRYAYCRIISIRGNVADSLGSKLVGSWFVALHCKKNHYFMLRYVAFEGTYNLGKGYPTKLRTLIPNEQ